MNFQTVFKLSPIASALLLAPQLTLAAQSTANEQEASSQDVEVIEVFGQLSPSSDINISIDDLDKRQAQDLNDIFRQESEISVGGSSGVSQKIYVRGIEDTMLNISIDGAEQSGSLFHHQGRLSIEPELLKQVEVSAGAGRATNGPGALGGAIRFETKDAHDLLQPGDKFGAQVKAGYYTNNNGYKGTTSLFGEVSEEIGLLASFSYVDGENIKDGEGQEQPFTALEQKIALLKLSGQLTDSQYASISYDYREDNGRRLNRPHFQPSFKNAPLNQEADRQTITLNHRYSGGEKVNIDSTLYNTDNRLAHKDHPRWGTTDGSINTHGAKISNTANFENNTLIFGADYKQDVAELSTGSGTGKAEDKGTVFGLFIQDDWRVTQALTLTAGARYDWYELKDSQALELDASGFSPNIGLDFKATNDLALFASYAQAMRGPQIKELYVVDYKVNDPNRKEEIARNTELGAKYQYQSFTAGVTFFHSEIEDVVGNQGKKITNIGNLKNNGVTAYLGYSLEEVSARLSYSQSRPELNGVPLSDNDMNIGTSVGDTWIADVTYIAMNDLEFGWNAKFVERLTNIADPKVNPEKPGYAVHDLYAQWLPISDEELVLTMTIKNVFDKFYYDHASYSQYIGSKVAAGYANAGRDFRFNVSYAF
ncbi:TonB-dependent receptor domain-containing protein [Vibrio tasmaniensis]|uniref:TonB-dependent receptor domain-containing protein n=1 Tax=Vibrio tasmaniensis TaxID=212663 RepID=UPI0010810AB5|nr:TonB-dependent receptor [Vibrio tasmaniensis]